MSRDEAKRQPSVQGGWPPKCGHCWHSTGRQLLTHPPQGVYRCCVCDKHKTMIVRPADNPEGHGPYHPEKHQ